MTRVLIALYNHKIATLHFITYYAALWLIMVSA